MENKFLFSIRLLNYIPVIIDIEPTRGAEGERCLSRHKSGGLAVVIVSPKRHTYIYTQSLGALSLCD